MDTKDKEQQNKPVSSEKVKEPNLGKWIMSNLREDSDTISATELDSHLKALHEKQRNVSDKKDKKEKNDTANKRKQKGGIGNWIKANLNVPQEISNARLNICKSCDEFRSTSKTCKVCNCFMPGKVHINNASCPKKKWGRAVKL